VHGGGPPRIQAAIDISIRIIVVLFYLEVKNNYLTVFWVIGAFIAFLGANWNVVAC
jgi:hypothetical protein